MQGEALCRIEVGMPGDVPPLRDALHHATVPTFEADVRFAVGYLIDRGIRGGCRILGRPAPGYGADLVFDDPELLPADVRIAPRVLSFDIETDPSAGRLLAISLYGLGMDEVLVVDPAGRPMPERAVGLRSERAVLEVFAERVSACDPDVLTGWNVIEFDLAVLARIAARVRLPLRLGRDDAVLRVRTAQRPFGTASAAVSGRLVLDGIELLRGAFVRQDDYSLDAVARAVLGEGKALAGSSTDRVGEIMANYRDDLAAFAHYARTDARLALDILQRLDLVDLAFARSRLTGMTPDRVSASIASFDFLYLGALHRRGVAAPTVRAEPKDGLVPQSGGQVLEPAPGLYELVWVFDFRSLYPSIIRTFNIDPLGFAGTLPAGRRAPDSAIVTPDGACFGRDPAILPQLLDELMPQREAAKRRGDQVAAQAIKILMNSFYGVLGTPACRFHNPAIANAITGLGRHLLSWTKQWFEARSYRVLYGDTDSLFVASAADSAEVADALGRTMVAALNEELAIYLLATWGVQSRLELQFEKLYARLLLPAMRHGPEGARKRYAGLRAGAAADAVEFVGMEVVRRDWTDLAKHVQRELYRRLFAGAPVADYLCSVVRALRAGELDDQLVYRKGLRKALSSYTANTPPHVAAARKSRNAPQRVVAYVMTTRGPEPLDALEAPPDREHYLERQVRPVAEPVLHTLGLDFDEVIGAATQLALF
jgi:DNA polymerase-2